MCPFVLLTSSPGISSSPSCSSFLICLVPSISSWSVIAIAFSPIFWLYLIMSFRGVIESFEYWLWMWVSIFIFLFSSFLLFSVLFIIFICGVLLFFLLFFIGNYII